MLVIPHSYSQGIAMSIDPTQETVISLTDAAKSLPARRSGKRPHVSCIYRWTTDGCKGVILESLQVGGTRCTSKEALARFFAALTSQTETPQTARTTSQRRVAVEKAQHQLQKRGA
jgi:hypothetical protein